MSQVRVILDDVIELIDRPDEMYAYLNKATGEVVGLLDEELSAAEDEDLDLSDYPEWQHAQILAAREVLDSEDLFLDLPGRWELDKYRLMERFCFSVENDRIRDDLLYAIEGRGAFRRFKDGVHRWGIEKSWCRYRDQAVESLAKDWLKAHGFGWKRRNE